ncbi:MAG: HAD family hydrolase [Pseudomonadota bacterium]
MSRWLIALDIDETQIEERSNPHSFEGEEETIQELRDSLNKIKMHQSIIIAHISNGMHSLFDAVEHKLANADYLTANASTCIYHKSNSGWSLEENYQELIHASGYQTIIAEHIADEFLLLEQTGAEHQTHFKRSFTFKDLSLSKEERLNIFDALQNKVVHYSGMKAFYVEGKLNDKGFVDSAGPYAVIDILPSMCTKNECINYIIKKENINSHNVIVAGNGDNDISMFQPEYFTIAVANAQSSLKRHSLHLADINAKRHIISKGIRSAGVLEGLRYFNIL